MTAVVVRPMLKGWSHVAAAIAAIALCPIMIVMAPAGTRVPAAIFSSCVVALFAVSGLFHLIRWTGRPFRFMQSLDHAMIFVVIAATYTPLAAVALPPTKGAVILGVVWSGAVAGVGLRLAWSTAPRPIIIAPYLLIGWVAIVVPTDLWRSVGPAGFVLAVAGGALHSIGAVIYARRRPNPWPRVFGFHELFHLFVIGGVACHYVMVAFFALR